MTAHAGQTAESPVVVVGGGPAGLMAAEVLAAGGAPVVVVEGLPTVGRKLLLAGIGGLNLTHAEPAAAFLTRYGLAPAMQARLLPALQRFGAQEVRDWAQGLGIDTFVGTSHRVFPKDMKAAPLLRAWLQRLRRAGVVFRTRVRWCGWAEDGAMRLRGADGVETALRPAATVLALGGASWPQLGSDGAWVPWLQARGVAISPLRSANCGFDVHGGWSEFLAQRHAGQPVKPVAAECLDAQGQPWRQQGEFVLTASGVEGSLIYACSALLREAIAREGHAVLTLDLLPQHSAAQVLAEVSRPRGPRSLATHLKSRLGISGLKLALLHEVLGAQRMQEPVTLAAALKALPLRLSAARPVAEAISTAGGVAFEHLDAHYMLAALPGVFCAGEMLDWEAPTGGYLITACLATGRAAGEGALQWWRAALAAERGAGDHPHT